VDVNLSEEEQVEALKSWWKENGRSVVGGVVLGLGAVFGWQAWNQYQDRVAGQGSEMFSSLASALKANDYESASKVAGSMIEQYQGSAYGIFAALDLARVRVEQGDSAAAQAMLRTALQQGGDASLIQIARLRLARLLFSDGKLDESLAVIAEADKDSFQGELAELRGDIARAKGDKAAASAAYQEALTSSVSNEALVQIKLEDLALAAK